MVIVLWLGALGAVVLIGACLAHRRAAAVVIGTVLAWVALPTVMILSTARQDGILGQGRDFMGLAVGIPIVAAAIAGERFSDRRTTLRLTALIVSLTAVCQVVDFYATLRRYMVGTGGPLTPFRRWCTAGRRPSRPRFFSPSSPSQWWRLPLSCGRRAGPAGGRR